MRFIVDIYRLIVLAVLAISLVAASYVAFLLLLTEDIPPAFSGVVIGSMIIGFVVVVLVLGITATFISMHDRIAEVSEEAKRMSAAIERLESAAPGRPIGRAS